MSDKDIIKGLKNGDNTAYKILYNRHYNTLCLYAHKIVADSFAARAIVNEVIFSLWKNRNSLAIVDLRSYLMRAVRNRCLNFLNQEKRRNNLHPPLSEEESAHLEDLGKYSKETPIDHLLAKELDYKIKAVIDTLPEQTRQIFLLSRSADLKYQEIADTLNISVDVVKYHIKQALQHLRNGLKDYFFKKIDF